MHCTSLRPAVQAAGLSVLLALLIGKRCPALPRERCALDYASGITWPGELNGWCARAGPMRVRLPSAIVAAYLGCFS